MFQSTPDLINRENVRSCRLRGGFVVMFQSTPDLINRENTSDIIIRIRSDVSIHSRFN